MYDGSRGIYFCTLVPMLVRKSSHCCVRFSDPSLKKLIWWKEKEFVMMNDDEGIIRCYQTLWIPVPAYIPVTALTAPSSSCTAVCWGRWSSASWSGVAFSWRCRHPPSLQTSPAADTWIHLPVLVLMSDWCYFRLKSTMKICNSS